MKMRRDQGTLVGQEALRVNQPGGENLRQAKHQINECLPIILQSVTYIDTYKTSCRFV